MAINPVVYSSDTDSVGRVDVRVLRYRAGQAQSVEDFLAIERALEIRVTGAEPVITMRTPGHDRELVAGLMLSEGLAQKRSDLLAVSTLVDQPDVVQVMLRDRNADAAALLARSSLSTSACGVCGKNRLNLELLEKLPPLSDGPFYSVDQLAQLPIQLRNHQALFQQTGGLHAAALFDAEGQLLAVREDVGRHNALDKLLGWALLEDRLPLENHAVLLSGRTSFELMQKCAMAAVPLVCSISAPSSYAVELATSRGITLAGFLREDTFNLYSHPARVL